MLFHTTAYLNVVEISVRRRQSQKAMIYITQFDNVWVTAEQIKEISNQKKR